MLRNNQVNAIEPIPVPQEPEGQLLNYEDVLHMAGAQNKYQIRIGILISLGMILAGLQIMGFPFMFREPAVECESTTTPGKWFECLPTEEMCKNHNVRAKDGTVKSIVVSFDFYCTDDEYRIIAETAYMLASALGVIAIAPIADKYGKRVALLVSYIVTSVSLVLCPFSPNWTVMLIFLIFSGLGRAPFIYYGFQLLVEVSNEHFRSVGVLIMGVTFAIGAAATSALNIAVNYNWEQFYLFFLAIPSVLGIPLVYYWADESPISYFPAHNYAEARKCLQRIAKVNGRTLPEFKFVPEQTYLPIAQEIEGEEMLVGAHKYSYLDLMRYKSLRFSVLGGAYVSFVTYFVFYGQILAIDVLTENPTFVAILTSLIEALACVASVRFLAKFTRKATMIISFTISAIAFLLYGIVTKEKVCDIGNSQCEHLFLYLEYVELSVGRFWIAMLMCTTFVYANELFPTVIRSRGSGVVNFFGRIGSIIPSSAIYFCKQFGISPALIFGAVAAPACLIVLFMRETKGKPLLHHIEEEEKADLEKQLLAEQLERMNYLNDIM